MSLHDLVRNSYFSRAVALLAGLGVLWWSGLLSPSGSVVERSYRTEATIEEIHDKAWLVRLPDGRQARVLAENARRRQVGDTVRLQVSRYGDGHEEAVVVAY